MADRFLELCRTRRSVRRFSDRPVEREKIEYCLEAAWLAPSADNAQPARFIVFDDAAAKEELADAVFGRIYRPSRKLAAAPVMVVLLVREHTVVRLGGAVQRLPLQFIDAAIAGEHFVLAAAEQGLGTCWIGWYDVRAVARHLKLGPGWRPVCLIATGYPAADWQSRPAKRRTLSEIAGWNRLPGRTG